MLLITYCTFKVKSAFLFSGTVTENIGYGRLDASDEKCIRATPMADADHFIHQHRQGYQARLPERASNLSQGQNGMLVIAGAILLDEATSSVDTRTETRIQRALPHLMENKGALSSPIAYLHARRGRELAGRQRRRKRRNRAHTSR
ncbi:MAG: hypothetical protein ACOYYS_16445 [Chloroflexota bacterium]